MQKCAKFAGADTLRVNNPAFFYVSVKSKLQHPPPRPGNPPGIWLFWKLLLKFPPTRAKMPFSGPH